MRAFRPSDTLISPAAVQDVPDIAREIREARIEEYRRRAERGEPIFQEEEQEGVYLSDRGFAEAG